MTHPDLHTLTGAYALNALDADERAAFESHLPDCPTCRQEIDGFLATTAVLGGAVSDNPPAHLRASVLTQIKQTRQEAPAPEQPVVTPMRLSRAPARRAWLERLVLPAAAVMALVVAGMSVVVGNLNQRIDEMAAGRDVTAVMTAADLQTFEAPMDGGGVARIVYSPSRGEGWFMADGMGGLDEGLAWQLWLIDDQGPAPAGVFHARDGRAVVLFTGDMTGVAAIGVTVEPDTGSLQPTSDPVVVVEM